MDTKYTEYWIKSVETKSGQFLIIYWVIQKSLHNFLTDLVWKTCKDF